MVEEIAVIEKRKVWFAMLAVLICIGIFIGGYFIGVDSVCKASGGTLFGKVCIDMDTVDYCYLQSEHKILQDYGTLRELNTTITTIDANLSSAIN